MDLFEANTHSFIIKVWLEETVEETGQATWRGHITHVSGGERRYLQELDAIAAFIAPYLETMGVKLEKRWPGEAWLSRLRTYVSRD